MLFACSADISTSSTCDIMFNDKYSALEIINENTYGKGKRRNTKKRKRIIKLNAFVDTYMHKRRLRLLCFLVF